MESPRKGTTRGQRGRRLALWAGLAVGGMFPAVGCQVEYAGMTLPSGKYMHDDVHYFQKGPDFPYANTQAATQRARMQAMGVDVPTTMPISPITGTPGAAAEAPPPPAPGIVPPPGGEVPPTPPAPGGVPAPGGEGPPPAGDMPAPPDTP